MDDQLQEENAQLRRELQELQQARKKDQQHYEANLNKERTLGKSYDEQAKQKQSELESMRNRMLKMTRQLDEEVQKRDQAMQETQMLERRLGEVSEGGPITIPPKTKSTSFEKKEGDDERGSQVSLKLMRVVDQWMRTKDLQQALLRGAAINDTAFSTLAQVLSDCPSLQTLDLSQNKLTMDSCSDICQLLTSAPSLSYVSLEGNLFSLRSIGYFMTAVMERQNTKKLTPLDLLDLQGNEGLVAAASAPAPENLVRQVNRALGSTKLPSRGSELISQVMRALWRFLHDTGHPQVKGTDPDEVSFNVMDKMTIRKMETALMKLLLLNPDEDGGSADADGTLGTRSVTADLAFITLLDPSADAAPEQDGTQSSQLRGDQGNAEKKGAGGGVHLPPIERQESRGMDGTGRTQMGTRQIKDDVRDPFADLKQAFEPPKEKQKSFNLKQIVTRNGTVLMNMLERLLETTEIDAHDVETEQTLLEFACHTANLGLAKLCYRRGANLSQRTKKGDTPFNIVTRNRKYDMMEFLHMYGVKVNTADAEGLTSLHVAASNDDVDGICRLIEWGADVNMRDNKKRTPVHLAASKGNTKATMLLLEVGADMNCKDEKEFTTVAHAEQNNHFLLMDRLVLLGGKGHGMTQKKGMEGAKSSKNLGELNVTAQMLKSSSLGRIGKVKVAGLPGPMLASMSAANASK